MKKMMKNRKGFTLMEMLIVVAIIAILVIIAIPTFNSALAKARAATDVANIRSGYAAALVEAMTNGVDKTEANNTYYLLKDGSVSNAAADATNRYTTQGESKNATANTTIGGKFTVGNQITWSKDQTIKYVVKDVGGVPTVDTITPEAASSNP